VANDTEVDLEVYLTKPATDLQDRFADWIMEVVGYDPSSAKTKEAAFREGVRIATATRMVFQASPENKAATKAKRQERAEAAEVEADEAPKTKKVKAAPEPEPVKPAKGKKAKAAAVAEETPAKAKKGSKGKGRRAAATADAEDVAPF